MAIYTASPCKLRGAVPIAGSKNASLPLLASSLLFDGEIRLGNVPDLIDIGVLLNLLRDLGSHVTLEEKQLFLLHRSQPSSPHICPQKAAKIRGSVLLLAPILGRYGEILLPLPGGCHIGKRPIDFHLYALEQLGAQFSLLPQGIYGYLPQGHFKGGRIVFPKPTVTGTENALMAGAVAHGITRIENYAQDDEVYELISLLRLCGVGIETSPDYIEVHGAAGLLTPPDKVFEVCADRMEAGTFLAGCGITLGEVFLQYQRCPGLEPILEHLDAMGMSLSLSQEGLHACATQPLKARSFVTKPHPGFPTDLQAPFLALNCVSEGSSLVEETIWENRFLHAKEFLQMGAQLEINKNCTHITGTQLLHGATIQAHDLRGSAASILLSLRAKTPSLILSAESHYERGYSFFLEKLARLGANLQHTTATTLQECQRLQHA